MRRLFVKGAGRVDHGSSQRNLSGCRRIADHCPAGYMRSAAHFPSIMGNLNLIHNVEKQKGEHPLERIMMPAEPRAYFSNTTGLLARRISDSPRL
jgi:hypothetical protein